jgi:hypothetical protein
MTLLQRNRFILIEIALAFFSFLILLISAGSIFPVFSEAVAEASKRTINIIQPLVNLLFKPQSYSVLTAIFISCIYALTVSILIYFFFEKTQCQEILFFTFFVLSFGFEMFRITVPWNDTLNLPRVYLIISGRTILFGRIFGTLSLLTSGIYAAGFNVQKQSHIILLMIVISMIIAAGVPLDALSWDSALNIVSGYSVMLLITETVIFFFAIMSFFIAAHGKESKEFLRIGLGSILLFFGRNLLLNCDSWIILPIAVSLLGIGTWYICSKLHQIYLWL